MKAVHITEFGGPDNLEVREIADLPQPEGTEVLVRVRAAGLNRADLLQARGAYPPPAGYSPHIPGLEFAGEVIERGPDASLWRAGDRVFGITAGEAQAELLTIDEQLLARIPDNLDLTAAAGVPEAFITAHDAVFTQARLQPRETLLIHAVGSGVGLAALQLAVAAGYRVIGTSRTADKLEASRAFGLAFAIETPEPRFADEVMTATDGRGADVIFDLVGGGYFPEDLRSLALRGRIMLVGLTAGRKSEFDMGLALSRRAIITGTVLRPRSIQEKAEAVRLFSEQVVPLLASGKVRPNVDRVFPAAQVREAYNYLSSNKSFGKIVLEF